MRLYTFILEKGGGTYISQHSGRDLRQAVAKFCTYAQVANAIPLNEEDCETIKGDKEGFVTLGDLTNAWCKSHFGADDELALINIVLTDTRDLEEFAE